MRIGRHASSLMDFLLPRTWRGRQQSNRGKNPMFVFIRLIGGFFFGRMNEFATLLSRHNEVPPKSLMKLKNMLKLEVSLRNEVSLKVSIVIPNYNGKKYLGECIDSIRSIDYPHEQYEVIVVDNASSDNSREFILSEYPDVILLQPERNLGFAGGCNLGIMYSRGEYIVLLNNDTIVDVNWLKELVAIVDGDTDVAIVGSKLLFKHDPTMIQNAGSYLTDRGDGGDIGFRQQDEGQFDSVREVMAVCGASMLIRRSAIEAIGAFDEDFVAYYEDLDLCYRARLYGKKVVFAHKSVVYHVHAATSVEWSPFFAFSVFRNKILMHLKNSPINYLFYVLILYCWQVIREGLIEGVNRKTHIKVLASLAIKLPKFLAKRIISRLFLKKENDAKVLRRLTKIKPVSEASSVKKVCVYNAYIPTMGGGENLTAHVIKYINSVYPSASIDILCHETDAFKKSKFLGYDFVDMLNTGFGISIKNTTVRFVDINIHQKGRVAAIRNLRRLSAITREYDLFINNTYSSFLPAQAKVNIYYCMFPVKFEIYGNRITRYFRTYFFNKFLKSYDAFFAISQFTQGWVDKYWGVNSYVLYPPVKAIRNSINRSKDNIIINLGRFFVGGHNKKQDFLIKAFAEMCDKGLAGDWKLVLVGRKHSDKASTSYVQSLEESVKGHPVELLYDLSGDNLKNLLNRAKIYWHATGYGEDIADNPERLEHFGLSTIEAAQFGVVPVVINAGGQPEIVSHAKNGFLWKTQDELINYTSLLMSNDDVRSALSSKAIDSMKIFGEDEQLRWFTRFLTKYHNFQS